MVLAVPLTDAHITVIPPVLSTWLNLFKFLGWLTVYLLCIGGASFTILQRVRRGHPLRIALLWLLWGCGVATPCLLISVGGVSHPVYRMILAVFR